MQFARMLAIFCVFLTSGILSGQAMDSREIAKKKYEEMKIRVIAGDLAIDWRAFRLAAALGEVSEGLDTQPVRARIIEEMSAKKYEQALQDAKSVTARNMANGEGHLLVMTVYQAMGNEQDAKKESAILDAIGKSIIASGDGTSASTAWFTVAPSESMFFLTDALGASFESHEFVRLNGHAYDKLTVLNREGKKRTVWFNTDTNEVLKERALHSATN